MDAPRALAPALHRQRGHDRGGRPRPAGGGGARLAVAQRGPGSGAGMSPRLDYEALIAGLPDAVVGVDDVLRVMLWNPAAESLLGRSARRTMGRALKEVFPPDTSLVRHLTDTLATGESRSESEAVIEGGDGRPLQLSVVTAPLAVRSGGREGAGAGLPCLRPLPQLESGGRGRQN